MFHIINALFLIKLLDFISGLLTMLLTTISVSVWSDFVGRRSALLVSFLGYFLQSLLFSSTIAFDLSMKLLLVSVFLSSFGGGLASILAVSFSYIADTTSVESRTFRIVIGDLFVGIGTILSNLSSGYWIEAQVSLDFSCLLQHHLIYF